MKFFELAQLQFIELMLIWEGRVSSTHLKGQFAISRQTAGNFFDKYRELADAQNVEQFRYCTSTKAYLPLDDFKPLVSKGDFHEYQKYFSADRSKKLTDLLDICSPLRATNPQVLQVVNRACRLGLEIEVDYLSMSNPNNRDGRIIAPHSVVTDGLRWHVRAYCMKNQSYCDFVIGRIAEVPTIESETPSEHTAENDERWQQTVDIVIKPDPRLSLAQQELIAMEYQMTGGQKTLTTRAALVSYVIKRLRIDIVQQTPEGQQIVLDSTCYKAIKQYMP
jgi:hypothetical protein